MDGTWLALMKYRIKFGGAASACGITAIIILSFDLWAVSKSPYRHPALK